MRAAAVAVADRALMPTDITTYLFTAALGAVIFFLFLIRFVCSKPCESGLLCHGDALAAVARELIAARDERAREAAPTTGKRKRNATVSSGGRRGRHGWVGHRGSCRVRCWSFTWRCGRV